VFCELKALSKDVLNAAEDVYLLTPNWWDPYSDVYPEKEAAMLDDEGEMNERKRRAQILLDDVNPGEVDPSLLQISGEESKRIDDILTKKESKEDNRAVRPCLLPLEADDPLMKNGKKNGNLFVLGLALYS